MRKKFYVTTPIYYVNDVPHVGHAYTTIAADVLARYHRLLGKDVFFLAGTDEHGAKVAEAAKEAGKKPKVFCDQVVSRFIDTWKKLNISNDYFIRTTDSRHEKIVQELLQKAYGNSHIYKGTYEGLYCVGCEKFLTETDLADGRCPLHPNREPVKQREKNYFFKLSAFKDKLIEAIEDKNDKNHYEILPEERKNEILGKLKQGLDDISISRAAVGWGIPIPWDKKQTIYVWVDALLNYYTATQFLKDKSKFWPAELHLIGKDILWFHTVIWQAFLLAAALPLPKQVFAHGFFTINGKKMSKSLGNVISPDYLIKKFGVDGARYLMLSACPFGSDGDISLEKFKIQYNADLANGLGNLVARIAKLCEKSDFKFKKFDGSNHRTHKKFYQLMMTYRFDQALKFIWDKISVLDHFIDTTKPWKLKEKKLKDTLDTLVVKIREIAILLYPFLPETAEKIEKQFAGPKIKSEKPLFPRLK
jgi:methionyl-tRNA synthetase